MRDPFTWSLPLGRLFGVNVRVHILFLMVAVALWLRKMAPTNLPGEADAMLLFVFLLLVAVLLHEFGHCGAARWFGGDVREMMVWPLGGFTRYRLPPSALAHGLTAAAGPLVNVLLCVAAGVVLLAFHFQPSLNPLPTQAWDTLLVSTDDGRVYGSNWSDWPNPRLSPTVHLVAQFFWINWFLVVVNLGLWAFPLDGAALLRAVLWPRLGFRAATHFALFVGFALMFVTATAAIVLEQIMILFVAILIYVFCKDEWIALETGGRDASLGSRAAAGGAVPLTVPESLEGFIEQEARAAGFASPADYLVGLIEEAKKRKTATGVQDRQLHTGLKSGEARPTDGSASENS
jgi:Zn-dependent protease